MDRVGAQHTRSRQGAACGCDLRQSAAAGRLRERGGTSCVVFLGEAGGEGEGVGRRRRHVQPCMCMCKAANVSRLLAWWWLNLSKAVARHRQKPEQPLASYCACIHCALKLPFTSGGEGAGRMLQPAGRAEHTAGVCMETAAVVEAAGPANQGPTPAGAAAAARCCCCCCCCWWWCAWGQQQAPPVLSPASAGQGEREEGQPTVSCLFTRQQVACYVYLICWC